MPKQISRIFSLLLSLIIFNTAFALDLTPERLKFRYVPNEDAASDCSHHLINDYLNDWIVKCPYHSQVKEFVVHLLVRNYPATQAPVDRFEIIYWVTNRIPDAKVPEFTGSTIWFNFEKETIPHSLKLSQQVDNSYAGLDLTINLR